ncbi:DUF2969 domain-containing protein [Lacticaseibacillus rhamnosus]|uniref:DUF2969 domain-containing protein n=1 Tax=Lacticaseibacillus rhamnosus TaxID=47715 RepID=UPI00065ABEF9|nr:DUF2969 domain-containing protein [Lacticaseibacillus rhamnosus]KMO46267.1 hypothetical protein PY95_09575 [Lacticaseibacillus rhamnosus]OAT99860.1 hypothetical protein PY72_09575 [Lacticaseibacillus rhamnosus]
MAKEKNIKVAQMDETRNGHTVSVLKIGDQEIGFIEPDGTRFAAYVAGSNKPNRFKNIDDAVNALIAEYHLHQG